MNYCGLRDCIDYAVFFKIQKFTILLQYVSRDEIYEATDHLYT